MFEKIPIILNSEQLIERSLRKTQKIKIQDRNSQFRIKKTIIAKTESFTVRQDYLPTLYC